MAATGGGKIRTRRYHIVSKPYAKSKQQPGLITRVADKVKSIVPWIPVISRYFKNGDVAEGEEAQVELEENNVAPPSIGNEAGVPRPHGNNSPEPSSSNAEPSTSKASLNLQDILSRPPLNRSHLHFHPHDGSPAHVGTSSLFSQPSTSTAPFTGNHFAVSPGFSLVKEIKDSSSQHEDDNISTTSGFSSRASDKDVPTSKSAPALWSPEIERTHSGSQLVHTSLKRPAFNLSVFSSSSSMNTSLLNSSQLGDSPFYAGKTTYGGAAAAKSARGRPGTPYQAPVRRQIKAKPARVQPCGVTSATARRILQTLERMSSPLADAKRIPSNVSSPLSTSSNHSDSDSFIKRKKLEPAVPPVAKLMTPAAAVVSGNRFMPFRPSLTPGHVSRTVEKNTKDTPIKRIPNIPDAVPSAPASTSSVLYPLSSTPATSLAGAGGGKMKRERSVRPSSKKPDDEVVELPDLPAVSLPIGKCSLPTFSFPSQTSSSSLTTSSTNLMPCHSEKPAVSKELSVSTTISFTFAPPKVVATAASPPSCSSTVDFTFSNPTMKTLPSLSNGKIVPAVSVKTSSESKLEFDGPFKPAKVLKEGSVLDILKSPGFVTSAQGSETETSKIPPSTTPSATSSTMFGDNIKRAASTRTCECGQTLTKASDKKCKNCQTPHLRTDSSFKVDSKPAKPIVSSLAAQFAPPAGSWECDTCMVENKPDVVKCVACDTAKPGTGVKSTLTRPPVFEAKNTFTGSSASSASTTTSSTSTTSGLIGFGDMFKKPEGAWDCDVCMVSNKAQDTKCVACQSAKPGTAAVSSQTPASTLTSTAPLLGFGDKFKKPEGSWQCDVCSVDNKPEHKQCACCQSNKPGAPAESKDSSLFSTQPSSTDKSDTSGFKFGTSSSNSSVGGLKFGGTFSDSGAATSGSFKFGNTLSDSSSGSTDIKFGTSSLNPVGAKFGTASGAPSEPATKDSSVSFKFGSSTEGFKFGAAATPVSTSEEKKIDPQNSKSSFKFGESSGIAFGANAASTTTTLPGGFSFGLPKTEKTELKPAFSFSTPTPKAEKEAPVSSTENILATATPAVVSSTSVFNKQSVTETTTVAPLFGDLASKETTPAPAAAFIFGKTEEKKDSPAASTGFPFSAIKEAEKPAPNLGFSFSKPDPPKEGPQPTFSFGKPAESSEIPKPTFGFGQTSTDNAAPKPTFGFMSSSSTAPASSNPAPNPFGSTNNSSLAPTPAPAGTFMFGQNTNSDAPPSKTFVFGQQQNNQPAPVETPAAPAQQAAFVFGSVGSPAPSFSFGSAASTPASTAPPPTTNPTPFGFTANTSTSGFGAGQTPAFGSTQGSVPAFGSPVSSFSAAPVASTFSTKPVFGQQSNPAPSFGSSTASANQSFQFAPSSGFGTQNSSGGFPFGSGAGATGSPAATPAMSTQPAAPGGGFNFTPNFNIGSTKSSLNSSTAGQHGISGRKIKTAVRRRK